MTNAGREDERAREEPTAPWLTIETAEEVRVMEPWEADSSKFPGAAGGVAVSRATAGQTTRKKNLQKKRYQAAEEQQRQRMKKWERS